MNTERETLDKFVARPDHDKCGEVSTLEALDILDRFIASHFDKKGEDKARFSIPVNFSRDDDMRMSAFIARAERAFRELEQLRGRAP